MSLRRLHGLPTPHAQGPVRQRPPRVRRPRGCPRDSRPVLLGGPYRAGNHHRRSFHLRRRPCVEHRRDRAGFEPEQELHRADPNSYCEQRGRARHCLRRGHQEQHGSCRLHRKNTPRLHGENRACRRMQRPWVSLSVPVCRLPFWSRPRWFSWVGPWISR